LKAKGYVFLPKMKKILFITPYPEGTAASQRFRFEQYYELLRSNGFEIVIRSFWSERMWDIFYENGHFFRKAIFLIGSLFKRIFLLFNLRKYDYIFIHREVSPVGPPLFSWIASKVLKKKIIFDFDDAIWLPNYSYYNRWFSFLKNYSNTKRLCKWAYKVSCGNDYLQDFAKRYNANTVLNPTTIDTEYYHNKIKVYNLTTPLVIGWTGTHSTIKYLSEVIPILQELEKELSFTFLVISDEKPGFELNSLEYIQWKKETEIDDLLKIDVGIMPLVENEWSKGKCGFKALQYMALGIPAIVSPVGVNTQIVNQTNGFVCHNKKEWEQLFTRLISQKSTLVSLSENARKTVEENYSVKSNSANFLHLFT